MSIKCVQTLGLLCDVHVVCSFSRFELKLLMCLPERNLHDLCCLILLGCWIQNSLLFCCVCVVVLKDLKYADSHEWVKIDGNKATFGITDHAQDHLGDVVYVELPDLGRSVSQGESFGAVESVKATSDINSPVSGKVVEVNEVLTESPGLVSPLFENQALAQLH